MLVEQVLGLLSDQIQNLDMCEVCGRNTQESRDGG
jgi:hypothetical protein